MQPTKNPSKTAFLSSRTQAVIQKVLRQALIDRKVSETMLHDWQGQPRPEVVAQLTESYIRAFPRCGGHIVNEVKQFLSVHKMSLRADEPGAAASATKG